MTGVVELPPWPKGLGIGVGQATPRQNGVIRPPLVFFFFFLGLNLKINILMR